MEVGPKEIRWFTFALTFSMLFPITNSSNYYYVSIHCHWFFIPVIWYSSDMIYISVTHTIHLRYIFVTDVLLHVGLGAILGKCVKISDEMLMAGSIFIPPPHLFSPYTDAYSSWYPDAYSSWYPDAYSDYTPIHIQLHLKPVVI